jgi:hypothetical protein
MTAKQHVQHAVSVALPVIASSLIELLGPQGALGHYHWSATALMLLIWGVRALNIKNPGPPAAVVVLLGAALACGGATCRTVGPVPPGGTLTDCSDAALHQAEIALIPQVENALALADYSSVTDALGSIVAGLTATVGAPLALAEVTCVVDWVVSEAEKAKTQTADSLEASKAAFGSRWVTEHGATVKPAGTL